METGLAIESAPRIDLALPGCDAFDRRGASELGRCDLVLLRAIARLLSVRHDVCSAMASNSCKSEHASAFFCAATACNRAITDAGDAG